MKYSFQIKTKEYFIESTFYPTKYSSKLVIIASATGVLQSFYQPFCTFLNDHGITALTFDYGGFGASSGKEVATAHLWGKEDLKAVIQWGEANCPNHEIILIGHSIGGQLIGLCSESTKASKILLVASQTGYLAYWPKKDQMKMKLAWKVLFPFFAKTMSYIPTRWFTAIENLPKGMALEWAKWCMSPNYLFDHIPQKELYFDRITAPLISLSTDNDPFASVEATNWLTNKYSHAKVQKVHLKPQDYHLKNIGHFGYFQKKNAAILYPVLLKLLLND